MHDTSRPFCSPIGTAPRRWTWQVSGFADCDATLDAYAHVVFDQAWRATKELG